GCPQVTAESPVEDTKAGHVPGPLWEDTAGEDGGLKEQRHLTAVLKWRRLHAPSHADAAQDFFVRRAESEYDLIKQAVETEVVVPHARHGAQTGGLRPEHLDSEVLVGMTVEPHSDLVVTGILGVVF